MNRFEQVVSEQRRSGTFFSAAKPIYISRAPGRLDLMGGNVDYTGGLVFEATIREATWAAAQLRKDRLIVLVNPQMIDAQWQPRVEFSLDSLTDEATVRAI